MPLSRDEFTQAVVRSGLLAADELGAIVAGLPVHERPKDAAGLATRLVKSGKLTEFQAEALLAGRTAPLVLGQYAILDQIGSGGMGQVYRARHQRMHRDVALKVLPPAQVQNVAAIQRFQREVRAAAKLSHINIVQSFDADEAAGVHYLVMEFVAGHDLAATVRQRGPLPVAEAVEYVLQTARGLEYAHGKGIVHRDIKPGNLLVNSEGTLKILDMGLARLDGEPRAASQSSDDLTGDGQVLGTADYMAPEQALDTHQADARADLYSLGCTLFRLLTGELMYGGDTAVQKIVAHREQPIPSLTGRRPDVPPEIEAIYRRLVAKRPEDRYQRASDVIADLEAWKGRGPVPPPPPILLNRSPPIMAGGSGQGAATGVAQLTYHPTARSELTYSPRKPESDTHLEITPPPLVAPPLVLPPAESPHRPAAPIWQLAAGAGILAVILTVGLVVLLNSQGNTGQNGLHPAKPSNNTPANPIATQAKPPETARAPFPPGRAHSHQAAWARYLETEVVTKTSQGSDLVLIPPGEFEMGASRAEIERILNDESLPKILRGNTQTQIPQHHVKLTRPFRLSATEVTYGQFRQFVVAAKFQTDAERDGLGGAVLNSDSGKYSQQTGTTWAKPGHVHTNESPVTQVSWNDAVEFCNWLSRREKLPPVYVDEGDRLWRVVSGPGYRLPTEAEWEFACRAGTTTAHYWGDDAAELSTNEWNQENSSEHPQPVAMKSANPFGLFDMLGNVREWVADWGDDAYYAHSPPVDPPGPDSGTERAVRGGAWNYGWAIARSAHHRHYFPDKRYPSLGIRVAQTVFPSSKP